MEKNKKEDVTIVNDYKAKHGLNLKRDELAKAAMIGLLGNSCKDIANSSIDSIVKISYAIAELMILESNKYK